MNKYSARREEKGSLEPNSSLAEGFTTIPANTGHSLQSNDVLKLFQDSFRYLLASENLQNFIQLVKGDLYNRDYIKAFGDDDRRMAYSARWTPSRSLCYSSLLSSLQEVRKTVTNEDCNVLCVGGGAGAELTGLCSVFASSRDFYNKDKYKSSLQIKLIDIADWSMIVGKLTNEIKKNWLYNEPDSLQVDFVHSDILNIKLETFDLQSLDLITLFFTTNELFAEEKAKSIRFFQNLSNLTRSGCYLLIAESAGSYSYITVGSKKFPIQFLIDTILLGKGNEGGDWELIKHSDSCWYRCEKDLEYPLKLENMRFFFRLYKKK